MNKEEGMPDVVERAFEALRRSHLPEGPDLQALDHTLQAVQTAQKKSEKISLVERIVTMNKFIKYPIAAAVAVAIFAAGAYMLLWHDSSITFAEVRERIEKIQTIAFTIVMEAKETEGDKIVMSEVETIKVWSNASGLVRMEGTRTWCSGTETPARQETHAVIQIVDMSKKEGIFLNPDLKEAKTVRLSAIPDFLNMLNMIKQAVRGENEELGDRTIGNLKAKGFRCKMNSCPIFGPNVPDKISSASMDIWCDESTGLPILIEINPKVPAGISAKMVLTDFTINSRLDDSLFDLKVPNGYAEIKERSGNSGNDESVDINQSPESEE